MTVELKDRDRESATTNGMATRNTSTQTRHQINQHKITMKKNRREAEKRKVTQRGEAREMQRGWNSEKRIKKIQYKKVKKNKEQKKTGKV